MSSPATLPQGVAVVYCEGAFASPYGKTAHGLVRFTRRYEVAAVVDSSLAGREASDVVPGARPGVPVVADLPSALHAARAGGRAATHFVIGLATDGGVLPPAARNAVREALQARLHVDSGLHEILTEDAELAGLARAQGVRIRDVRQPPPRRELHFYSGKIRQVQALVVAVLGTDSAVGKRTTAWAIVHEMERRGRSAELVGTGQTAWMQGARFGLVLDSLVNDFVAGEIEHAVWSAWTEAAPELIVVEGQGSLMHPAYPGGFEILAAARPDCVVLQHAPARLCYDGFEGCPLHPLERQIAAIELVSSRQVAAIALNREGLDSTALAEAKSRIAAESGRPTFEVLSEGAEALTDLLLARPRVPRGPQQPVVEA